MPDTVGIKGMVSTLGTFILLKNWEGNRAEHKPGSQAAWVWILVPFLSSWWPWASPLNSPRFPLLCKMGTEPNPRGSCEDPFSTVSGTHHSLNVSCLCYCGYHYKMHWRGKCYRSSKEEEIFVGCSDQGRLHRRQSSAKFSKEWIPFRHLI